MRPLPAFGISAWSWINAAGHHAHIEGSLPSSYVLDGSSLRPSSLDLPGAWGKVSERLPELPADLTPYQSRCSQLLFAALQPLVQVLDHARERYGAGRVAVVLGSSTGGMDATEQAFAHQGLTGEFPAQYVFEKVHAYNALVCLIRDYLGLRGPGFVLSTACSSSAKALATAQRLLATHTADAVLTGGVDALCEMTLRGFAGLGILSPTYCRPFDGTRDGLSIGEGAALLLLERHTSSPYRLVSAGETNDAYHQTAPHPTGRGAYEAMLDALRLGQRDPLSLDYINAHGTGTTKNDQAEALAIQQLVGDQVPFSSTKDRIGHLLGAAGATEALFCLHALVHRTLPENSKPQQVDESLPVQPLVEKKKLPRFSRALSNSFAFGGNNVSLLLENSHHPPEEPPTAPSSDPVYITGVSLWSPSYPSLQDWLLARHKPAAPPQATLLSARTRGRASLLTRIFAELYSGLEESAPLDREKISLIFGSAYGEIETTLFLLDQMQSDSTLSPMRFQSSVHNTAAGLLSIATGHRAFSTALAAGDDTFAMSLLEGINYITLHGGEALVLVADEPSTPRLYQGPSFPALGLGLRIVQASSAPPSALARLSALAEAPEQDAPPSGRGFASAPAAWGMDLIAHLAHRRGGRIRLGPKWQVDLEPLSNA